ncbi:MAG: hypothetical protein ACI81T_000817, partial [Bacteroidia bacterium]
LGGGRGIDILYMPQIIPFFSRLPKLEGIYGSGRHIS